MSPSDNNTAGLSIDLDIAYPGFRVQAAMKIPLQGVTGLFGPSGAGKSTLLRAIAGLESGARGQIEFAGDTWLDSERGISTPPHHRPVGYVFQDARLFSHLDVEGNLRYGLKRSASPASGISMDEVVSIFELQKLLHRGVEMLSGGERQRVAMARTLLARPRLLLLDEPLAGLDNARKWEILPYLDRLSSEFGIPLVYVSHSVEEIARLAEHVVIMENGKVMASGAALEVLNSSYVQHGGTGAEAGSILEARVAEHLEQLQLTRLDFHGHAIFVPLETWLEHLAPVRLYVRAGDVAIATRRPEGLSFRNVLPGTISDLVAESDSAFVTVLVGVNGTVLRSRLTRHAAEELGLRPGLDVFALLKTASLDHRIPALA